MKTNDLNGTGEWSRARVQERYMAYCLALELKPSVLIAEEHSEGQRRWIYPVLDSVVDGVKHGDGACIAIGIDLIEEDQGLPFGRLLKANVAKALRRIQLTDQQKARLRKRIVFMLIAGNIQREFREYIKLLRHVGVAEYWPELHSCVPRDNVYAMRFYDILCKTDPSSQAGCRSLSG